MDHLWENSFTVRLAHRSQNFYHLISSQVKHSSIGSINVFIYWLVIQFFILSYNHLPSVRLFFWPDINVFKGFLSRHSKCEKIFNRAKIRKVIIKFIAFMHAAKQVWIWYSCLYWPALFLHLKWHLLSLAPQKCQKKNDLANIQTNWPHVRTIMHMNNLQ